MENIQTGQKNNITDFVKDGPVSDVEKLMEFENKSENDLLKAYLISNQVLTSTCK